MNDVTSSYTHTIFGKYGKTYANNKRINPLNGAE